MHALFSHQHLSLPRLRFFDMVGESDATCENLLILSQCQRNLVLNEPFLKGVTYTNKLKDTILLEKSTFSHILLSCFSIFSNKTTSLNKITFHDSSFISFS